MSKYICSICGFIYDEAIGYPKGNISAGTKWDDLPSSWVCPLCTAAKSDFQKSESESNSPAPKETASSDLPVTDSLDFTIGEISVICSNLSKGCEKQYRVEEADLFNQLSLYFKSKMPKEKSTNIVDIQSLIQKELETSYSEANKIATKNQDRGGLRALKWSEQVTRMSNAHLNKYEEQNTKMLEDNHVFVCEICGFVYIGDDCPERCPVCKVPSMKLTQMQRRA